MTLGDLHRQIIEIAHQLYDEELPLKVNGCEVELILALKGGYIDVKGVNGWHPASEFPPVDKETGLSEEVIAIQDRFCDGERVIYSRIVGSGWKHPNIKLWIEQPKEG